MSTKKQSPMTEKESVRWRVANAHIDPDIRRNHLEFLQAKQYGKPNRNVQIL